MWRALLHAGSSRAAVFGAVFLGMLALVTIASRSNLHGETQALDARYFFLPAAKSFWEQGVPLQHDGKFCTHQPPLWPLVLAGPLALQRAQAWPEAWVVRGLTALCAGAAALGLLSLGRRWLPAGWAAVAAMTAMFLPPVAWLHREAYNEPLFIALLVWATLLSPALDERPNVQRALLAGVLLGAATLTRAIGMLVPVVLIAATLVRPRVEWRVRLPLWLVTVVVAGVTVAPWSIAASRATGKLTLVTTSFAHSHVDGLIHLPDSPVAARAAQQLEAKRDQEAVLAFHRAELARDPFAWLGLWLRKLPRSFFATESRRGEGVLLLLVAPLCALGAVSAGWLWWRRPPLRPLLAAAVGLFVYFWAMSTAVWSTVRYIVPVLWVPLLLAAIALQTWLAGRATPPQPAGGQVGS